VYRQRKLPASTCPRAFEGDVATVTESADLLGSKRSATRPSAWTSGNTRSTRISFQPNDDQHPPTIKALLNRGFQSYSRSLNRAENVPLQRLTDRMCPDQRLAEVLESAPGPATVRKKLLGGPPRAVLRGGPEVAVDVQRRGCADVSQGPQDGDDVAGADPVPPGRWATTCRASRSTSDGARWTCRSLARGRAGVDRSAWWALSLTSDGEGAAQEVDVADTDGGRLAEPRAADNGQLRIRDATASPMSANPETRGCCADPD
jgi:hypothetical protein